MKPRRARRSTVWEGRMTSSPLSLRWCRVGIAIEFFIVALLVLP